MRIPVILLVLLLGSTLPSLAATSTAFDALKVLPKAQARKLARIEARRGTPTPERWHLLVHDAASERGLREYVVAAGEVVASRTLSQFADQISEDDVIADAPLKIDSDRAADLAQQYALANGLAVASMNFELRREGADATPLWRVTCLDEEGKELGSLILTATKGTVISHPGFSVDPETLASHGGGEFRPQHQSEIAAATDPAPDSGAVAKASSKKKTSQSKRKSREQRPNFFQRAGGTVQKFFTGRD
ncbi:MAG TPA: hypothetical protein VF614_17750 [Chthoniobacteraceae bacterium]|jgi:hypothetical protein